MNINDYRRLAGVPALLTEDGAANAPEYDIADSSDDNLRVAMFECGQQSATFDSVMKIASDVPPEHFGDESDAKEEDAAIGWCDMLLLVGPCSEIGLPAQHVTRLQRWLRASSEPVVLRGTFICIIDTSEAGYVHPSVGQVAAFCYETGAVFAGDGYAHGVSDIDNKLGYIARMAEMCERVRARLTKQN